MVAPLRKLLSSCLMWSECNFDHFQSPSNKLHNRVDIKIPVTLHINCLLFVRKSVGILSHKMSIKRVLHNNHFGQKKSLQFGWPQSQSLSVLKRSRSVKCDPKIKFEFWTLNILRNVFLWSYQTIFFDHFQRNELHNRGDS